MAVKASSPGSTRRTVIQSGAALAAASCMHTPLEGPKAKPNILFIMADDLGYADLSCYGRRDYATPAADGLAASGVRFLQGYANSAVCSATRTALITGRYQYRLPVGLEEPLAPNRDVGLPPEHPTLPSLLKQAGYQTALIGKWHLGRMPRYSPLKSGYDHFWGFREGSVDYFSHKAPTGELDLWDGDTPVETAGYLTDLLGDRAIQTIEDFARSDRPFFMSLHFNAPHWPWEGPNDQAESRRLEALPAAPLIHFDGGSLATYAEIVTAMDRQIGRVLDTLRKLGIADNTIVVFTSDNGGERFSETWPFTGMKTELLEGGLRVPLIIRWPGVAKPGAVCDQVAITMDLVPTLLAAAGASPHPDYPSDGKDLRQAIAGAPPVPRKLFFRYLHLDQQAYRDGDWKYLRIAGSSFLFDVVKDPLERANLNKRHADVFERMVADYKTWEKTMLPLDPKAMTHGYNGERLANHFSTPD